MYMHDICVYVLGCSWLYNSTDTESQYYSQEHHSLFESVRTFLVFKMLTITWKCNDTVLLDGTKLKIQKMLNIMDRSKELQQTTDKDPGTLSYSQN